MTVEVRYFASLRQWTGCSHERIEIDPGTDVSALWDLLRRRHPRLSEVGFRPLVACNRSYAAWDRRLEEGSEVAFLPPVSGG